MKIVLAEVIFEWPEELDQERILKKLEKAGRTAYKSEDKITDQSATKFIGQTILTSGHESVIEHCIVTLR